MALFSITQKNMRDTLNAFKAGDVDAYAYLGSIEKAGYDDLCGLLDGKTKKASKVLLYLMTRGGNPNVGYRIARALSHHYGAQNFRVAIPAECKSAGTLICIGAHSLVVFDKGELGPLDIQFQKKDEIFQQSSGLDILRGMTYLQQQALDTFNTYLIEINGGRGLSTKTASEIASNLVRGLYEPVFAQVDPIRLGEMNAALQIANEYGTRLADKAKNLKAGSLSKLIHSYPTHGFVIDRAEVRTLFERVAPPSADEELWGKWCVDVFYSPPPSSPLVLDLVDFFERIYGETDGTSDTGGTGQSAGTGAVEPQRGANGEQLERAEPAVAADPRQEQLPHDGQPGID